MPATTSPPPLPPALLAQRYRLERRLAQGGMAEVWLGTDTALSRQVAIKLLKPSLASDPIVAERFRREAIAVAQLSHPNIVAVHDAIEDNGRQAVVMQLVNGKSLRQLLDDQRKLSPDLTIHIGQCVASALDAAHAAGMVHRDVKPGNILITPEGRVLLTDFGIAKGLEPDGSDLTNDNIMMGTAKYLSPEQVRGKRLDGRADLYSLGLVLYECLAGRVPFLGQSDADTALARLQRDPTDITRLRPTLPAGLPELIHKLLARRPDQRYPNGAAVRAALSEIAATANDPTRLDHTGTPTGTPTGRSVSGGALVRPTDRLADRPADRPADRHGETPRTGYRAVPAPTPSGPVSPVGPLDPAARRRASERQPNRTTTVGRDRTPSGQVRVQPRPNKQFEHRATPSLVVVGGLLLAATVLSVVLWYTGGGRGDDPAPVTTASATTVAAAPASTVDISSAALVTSITTFDPDGDDGSENDGDARLAIDGDPDTAWSTSCYEGQFLNGKRALGLVVTLARPVSGTVTVAIDSAPFQVEVFAIDDPVAPADVDGWGDPLARLNGDAPADETIPLIDPVSHLLVSFREGGSSGACSDANPHRGTLSEIVVTASS
jgi:serine/threonine-protein kinase